MNDNKIPEFPSNISYPGSSEKDMITSLTKLLLQSSDILNQLRREFRGEALHMTKDGGAFWVQVSKPIFVKIDLERNPLRQLITLPDGSMKEIYVPHDEAIEEILGMLKFSGVNQITPITKIPSNNILDDLKEFECKLAALLAIKQPKWGIDKEMLPIIQFKIKTLVQDARYMCENGNVLEALTKSVQRIEQHIEGDKTKRVSVSPYG
jgi:hypothetical protein